MTQLTSFFIIVMLVLHIVVLRERLARVNWQIVVQPDEALDQEVADMLRQRQTIVRTVKYVREKTGLGLWEAKQ
ncbi:hypothetical protein [Domibacillus tundrae]|uniref:hypothetical protein n=1 Tax=Domibacillus tundrae TaxID=1587527 RepID=UPI003392782C